MRTALLFALLTTATLTAQSAPKPPLHFDVVSIKQDNSGAPHGLLQISPDGDRVVVTNAPMYRIVAFAFNFLRSDLVLGAPDWARTERWDMEAKVAPADLPAFHALNFIQQKAMLQTVLAERCSMQAHVAKKEVPVYALVLAKSGIKMHELRPNETPPVVYDAQGKPKEEWDLTMKRGEVRGRGVPMEALMYALSDAHLDRQVIDRTGLTKLYNFDLLWTPEEDLGAPQATTSDTGLGGEQRPSIFTAIQEQLGLRLEPTRASVDALLIEHIERPTND